MNEKRQIPDSILCPHCGKPVIKYRNPLPTVDVIISHDGGVVLVLRKNPPAGWAIPGGFIDYGESAEDAAIREMKEETGLDIHNLELFTVRSDPGRDPRHHTLTVVFTAEARGTLEAGDDALDARVYSLETLPAQIAFDHRDVLQLYFQRKG